MESHINLEQLFQLAILEDLGPAGIKGDITSKAIAEDMVGKARIIAKMDCCISGLMVAKDFYRFLDPGIEFKLSKPDGSIAKPGEELAMVSGPLRYLLAGERIALNFIMHLSGIATYTNRFVEAIKAYPGYILDTRKTTPGLRLLEKEAVMHGKGKNHRLGYRRWDEQLLGHHDRRRNQRHGDLHHDGAATASGNVAGPDERDPQGLRRRERLPDRAAARPQLGKLLRRHRA